MADKMTHTGSYALRGIVPPDEARAKRRNYLERELARIQRELAKPDSAVEVTYRQGTRRLHPDCEDRPAETMPTPEGATTLGDNRGLLLEAVELTIDSQFASPAFLQRKLRVGFAKAGLLMQLMEERGIVSPVRDFYKRDVLVPREDKAPALNAIRREAAS
jgi:DNA segregation ATPase FtsK/SpoIIIE-like protein